MPLPTSLDEQNLVTAAFISYSNEDGYVLARDEYTHLLVDSDSSIGED